MNAYLQLLIYPTDPTRDLVRRVPRRSEYRLVRRTHPIPLQSETWLQTASAARKLLNYIFFLNALGYSLIIHFTTGMFMTSRYW